MPNSAYFARRAAHYRQFAAVAPNEKTAECQLALANLFLQLSGDLQQMELTAALRQDVEHGPRLAQLKQFAAKTE
jgi:hypothetical protein